MGKTKDQHQSKTPFEWRTKRQGPFDVQPGVWGGHEHNRENKKQNPKDILLTRNETTTTKNLYSIESWLYNELFPIDSTHGSSSSCWHFVTDVLYVTFVNDRIFHGAHLFAITSTLLITLCLHSLTIWNLIFLSNRTRSNLPTSKMMSIYKKKTKNMLDRDENKRTMIWRKSILLPYVRLGFWFFGLK